MSTKKKITKYLQEKEDPTVLAGAPIPTPEEIRKPITFNDVRLLNAFHLFLTDDFKFIQQPDSVSDPKSEIHYVELLQSLNTSVSYISSIVWLY